MIDQANYTKDSHEQENQSDKIWKANRNFILYN